MGAAGGGSSLSDPLPMKRCTDEDLGLGGHESKEFYPPHSGSIGDLKYYKKKLWCFDYEEMERRDDIPDNLEI